MHKHSMLVPLLLGVSVSASDYNVDMKAVGLEYNGIGGLSGGGATSRLLVHYKEPQRGQILDYLFKPNFGANLQILKVEIGGDSQSTDGVEPSHMHSKDDMNLKRGYEWWLMKEAKKRNPDIKLYGLPWAFPGWVGNNPDTGKPSGSPFSYPNQTASYITSWVAGAKSEYGLDIDFIGIWNERTCTKKYVKALKDALKSAGFGNTKLVANDDLANVVDPQLCNQLLADKEYASLIDVIGFHYANDQFSYESCHKLGKPVWASEESSSYDSLNGAACWARVTNSHYVLSGMTASIMWNLVGSYYHGTNWYASSMLTAVQPWSGYFENMYPVWATAHLTQFTQIGWRYITVGSGSGKLAKGGYYAALVSPDGEQITVVAVKISHDHAQCTRPPLPAEAVEAEVASFKIPGLKPGTKLTCFKSNYQNGEAGPQFEKQADVDGGADGVFTVNIAPGDYITLSTVSTAAKGVYTPPKSDPAFPLPHFDNFNSYPVSQEADYCADQIGSFEVVLDSKNSTNKVMRQTVPQLPIGWSDHGSRGPMSLLGMKEWGDVFIQIDFRVPTLKAWGCVATRSNQMWSTGVVFCVEPSGKWNVTYSGPLESGGYSERPIISGEAPAFGINEWVTIKLLTLNGTAQGWIHGTSVFNSTIRNIDNGFVVFGTNGWYHVEYDNLQVKQVGTSWPLPPPKCGAAVAGAKVAASPCQPNGDSIPSQQFELTSNFQVVHIPSGLCLTASTDRHDAVLTLEACLPTPGRLQQFHHDYTRVRNAAVPLTLIHTTEVLSGSADGSLHVGGSVGHGDWNTWSYFPNTFQLRNQYDTNKALGYPRCLSVCP